MPLLDIEKAIRTGEIDSRFRLVSIASQRARELNMPAENTTPAQHPEYTKVTTNALNEIIRDEIKFQEATPVALPEGEDPENA
jgi:DNA-directed RNA polymerase omega subunit